MESNPFLAVLLSIGSNRTNSGPWLRCFDVPRTRFFILEYNVWFMVMGRHPILMHRDDRCIVGAIDAKNW